jgi:hypothetical protein
MSYRLYPLTSEGRIAGPPAMVEFESDAEAIASAYGRFQGVDVEVWNGSRKVAHLTAAGTKGAASDSPPSPYSSATGPRTASPAPRPEPR